jgi:Ser/Thr protein kinase RdoA (MazF antagonist)
MIGSYGRPRTGTCAHSGADASRTELADSCGAATQRERRVAFTLMAPDAFDATLQRMYDRVGVDTLPDHLESSCDITVEQMTQLDVGVFRVDRREGTPLVVRMFSAARSPAAAQADMAVLRHLEQIGFPAERPLDENALTRHQDQSVLVTHFIRQVPKPRRPPHSIIALGAIVGRLHTLDVPDGADRPAGALHHFAEGTMTDELAAAARWLDAIEARVPAGAGPALDTLRTAVLGADGGNGLPEALVHPDPVPVNVMFTEKGPILVDWTASGRGPRLASLMLVLRSGWAAAPFLRGYTKRVSLTDDERDRLPGLIMGVFRVCREPKTVVAASRRLGRMRRECDAKAAELLS